MVVRWWREREKVVSRREEREMRWLGVWWWWVMMCLVVVIGRRRLSVS